MGDGQFWPDDVEVAEDGKGNVGVSFMRDGGAHVEVFFAKSQLPFFVAQLQKKISPGDATPIRPHNLQMGTNYQRDGHSVSRHPSGDVVLTFMISISEGDKVRGVTMPMRFSPQTACALVAEIEKALRLDDRFESELLGAHSEFDYAGANALTRYGNRMGDNDGSRSSNIAAVTRNELPSATLQSINRRT